MQHEWTAVHRAQVNAAGVMEVLWHGTTKYHGMLHHLRDRQGNKSTLCTAA